MIYSNAGIWSDGTYINGYCGLMRALLGLFGILLFHLFLVLGLTGLLLFAAAAAAVAVAWRHGITIAHVVVVVTLNVPKLVNRHALRVGK